MPRFPRGEEIMKIRRIAVAAAIAAAGFVAATPAQANDWVGSALGAVVGGVIGNQFGGGSGNVAATALGAAIGSRVGGDISRGMPPVGSSYGYGSGYRDYSYRDPAYREPVRYEPAYYRPAPPAYGQRRLYDERTVYGPPPPPAVADACAGELYYEGRYDPDLARAYCRGRQEYMRGQRERELADARNRGLSGQ
jgi:hypothetical protein